MKKITAGLLPFLLTPLFSISQDTIPHIKGTVIISVKKGTIDCDLTLSNMPRLKDYYLRLNSGMNIRYIKNAEPGMQPLRYERSLQDTLSSGESSAYFIPGWNETGKYLPHTIRLNYAGMYPVIRDTSSVVDWRGNIAFNGKTLRADGIQSAWSPILYDIKTDTRYENVTYDLEISCPDCKVIYLNGSQPVSGTRAKLSSNQPQDLTLFAGEIKSVPVNGTYFLNPDANQQQLTELEKTLQSYRRYLEKRTAIPYNGKAVYIQTTPVSKNNSWLFASYPTIVKVGWDDGMKTFMSKTDGPEFLQYMAHEIAHYYFGRLRSFNSPIGDMISEGFAEFLALDITRRLINESLYRENLQSKARTLQHFNPAPPASIQSKNDYKDRERYVYYYAPLIFAAIEKEIGETKMNEWIHSLLNTPASMTSYSFFEQTLNKVIADSTLFHSLRDKYFISENSLPNAISTLNLKTEGTAASKNENPVNKTYYYFLFSRPLMDIGSSQNKVIVHTDIGVITCNPQELTKQLTGLGMKVKEECRNDSGSTSDLNTYNTREEAEAALKRWLDRYNKNGTMTIKMLKTEDKKETRAF